LVMFSTAGLLGWTSFPQAFGLVTRVLLSLAKSQGVRFTRGYCDDFSGVTVSSRVDEEVDVFTALVERLLGSGAVNRKKTEKGRKVVLIGWEFDLDGGSDSGVYGPMGSISLSDRNLLKTAHGFFSLPASLDLERSRIERLASWMSRYSALVFPQLRPFAAELFSDIRGLKRSIVKSLSAGAKNATLVWRAFTCLLTLQPRVYRRSLAQILTFASSPKVKVNFDASLRGLGIRLFHLVDGSCFDSFRTLRVPLSVTKFGFAR